MITSQKAKTIVRTAIECPHCQNELDVEWYVGRVVSKEAEKNTSDISCNDCDKRWAITIHSRDDIDIAEIQQDRKKGLMLVVQADSNVYLVIEHTFYKHRDKAGFDTDLTYWVDEHTCPTNWLPVLAVISNGDPDPHGVFRFVRAMTFDDIQQNYGYTRQFLRGDENDNFAEQEALFAIFPELEVSKDV